MCVCDTGYWYGWVAGYWIAPRHVCVPQHCVSYQEVEVRLLIVEIVSNQLSKLRVHLNA